MANETPQQRDLEARENEERRNEEYRADPKGFLQRAQDLMDTMDKSEVPHILETLQGMGFRLESRVRDNASQFDNTYYQITYILKREEGRDMPEMTVKMKVLGNGYCWLEVHAQNHGYDRTFYNNPVPAEDVETKLRQIERSIRFDTRLARETGFHFETYYGDRDIIYVRAGEGNIPELELIMSPAPYFFEGQQTSVISINVPSSSDSGWAHFPNPERYNLQTTVNGPGIHEKILDLIHQYTQRVVLHRPS